MEQRQSKPDVLALIEDETIRSQALSVLSATPLSFEAPPGPWSPEDLISRFHPIVYLFDFAAIQRIHSPVALKKIPDIENTADREGAQTRTDWQSSAQSEVRVFVILPSIDHRAQLESRYAAYYECMVHDSGFDINLPLLLKQAVCNVRLREDVATRLQKYEILKENVQDIIWMADTSGKITFITETVRSVLDFSPQELEGRPLEDLFTADSGSMLKSAIHGALEGLERNPEMPPGTRVLELEQLKRDGSTVWTEISINFITDNRGGMKLVSGVMRNLAERKQAETNLIRTFEKYRRALEGIVAAMGKIVEIRDPYTAGHQQKATRMACDIAALMGLSKIRQEALRIAGSMHDLGKISIPAEILTRPGKLREAELKIIRSHPRVGYEILHSIEFPWPIARIILSHHERMDGSGYPEGLREDEIPLESRILAVADVFEAMTSHRPYRPAFTPEDAIAELVENAGRLYDRKVVAAFQELLKSQEYLT